MSPEAASLAASLEQVRARLAAAARRAGRDPSTIMLVAVTKGLPAQVVQQAAALGVTDVGENRVQEARAKQEALGWRLEAKGSSFQPPASSLQPVRWHLIGHLQRNKAREAVERFALIHSVDSAALVDELEQQAATLAQGSRLKAEGKGLQPSASSLEPCVAVFIQVNVSGEETKFGCGPHELTALAQRAHQCAHVRLAGLMTMAPQAQDPEASRPWFNRLRQLRDELAGTLGIARATLRLSMGMSQDFEVAIEEGADLVRIGSAIFGARGEGQGARDQQDG